jgi:hypothetical protein
MIFIPDIPEMVDLHRNQNFSIKNLIRFRKKLHQSEINPMRERLEAYLKSRGAKRVGRMIAAIHELLDLRDLDIEIFLEIDKEIPSNEDFFFQKELTLNNCWKSHFHGMPYTLINFYAEIERRAYNSRLGMVYPYYLVYADDPEEVWGFAFKKADVYVLTRALTDEEIERIYARN